MLAKGLDVHQQLIDSGQGEGRDSQNEVFLEGTRLIPRNNLHWFHGTPIHQTGALGLLMDLDIKSLSMVQCATVTNNFNSYDLWHSCLGHPNPQTIILMTVLFVTNITMKALTVIPCAPLRRVTTNVLAYHLTTQDKKPNHTAPSTNI